MPMLTSRPSWPLLALTLTLSACGSTGQLVLPSAPVEAARIPALPATARQPEAPTFCSPNCSSALTVERESWLRSLTSPELPASSASSGTTH